MVGPAGSNSFVRFTVLVAVLLPVCHLVAACRSGAAQVQPLVEFTTVPPADNGGPDKLALVAGRVKGARPNQRIVLFAKSGNWWVQPFRSRPFTAIDTDSTWKATIHLGTDYAALLVDQEYRPPVTSESVPSLGNGVVAVATVKGSGTWVPPVPKTLTFSGYDWVIVQTRIDRHGPNDCDARNVWVDPDGHLHLLLAQRDGQWTSAGLTLNRPLGYGTYMFTVRETGQLDPAAALSMYTWDDRADSNHRELNVSIGNWGSARNKNGMYVLLYEDVAENVLRFTAPAGRLTHTFRWQPGNAIFTTVRGDDPAHDAQPVARRAFTVGVPTPATATVRLALLHVREAQQPPANNVEVVVEKFVFLP
jgi:hypothetical protein